jgi:hypothetical protein
MTSEDVIWGLGSWMVSNVDVGTLRKLVDCEGTFIEDTAQRVYTMAENDTNGELGVLLGNLSTWRDHPSTKGTHLSGLREALRHVSKAFKQYSDHPRSRRLGLYRQLMAAPATSELKFIVPVVAVSKEAVA